MVGLGFGVVRCNQLPRPSHSPAPRQHLRGGTPLPDLRLVSLASPWDMPRVWRCLDRMSSLGPLASGTGNASKLG